MRHLALFDTQRCRAFLLITALSVLLLAGMAAGAQVDNSNQNGQSPSSPPGENATPAQLKDAKKRADEAYKQAKATKTAEEFGLLAEKISEDDYRVMLGDHKWVDRSKLPPNVANALASMKKEDVSALLQVDQAYVVVRLNGHRAAGKAKFEDVKAGLIPELEKRKTNEVRAALDRKLAQNAKVEVL